MKPQDVDVLLRIMQIADAPQNLDAMQYVIFQFDFKDYEQFILECPPGSIRFNNFLRVAVCCDNLGVLVDGGAAEPETVFELYPIPWTKMEPIVMGCDASWCGPICSITSKSWAGSTRSGGNRKPRKSSCRNRQRLRLDRRCGPPPAQHWCRRRGWPGPACPWRPGPVPAW